MFGLHETRQEHVRLFCMKLNVGILLQSWRPDRGATGTGVEEAVALVNHRTVRSTDRCDILHDGIQCVAILDPAVGRIFQPVIPAGTFMVVAFLVLFAITFPEIICACDTE